MTMTGVNTQAGTATAFPPNQAQDFMRQQGNRLRAVAPMAQTDRTRRFGYSAGTPNMTMDVRVSGLDCDPIEGGRLLMFTSKVEKMQGLYNEIKQAYVVFDRERFPAEFAYDVQRMYQELNPCGFRNLPMLTELPYSLTTDNQTGETLYTDEAYSYFNIVHPRLPSETCEFGLFSMTRREHGQDIWQECPTCRLRELRSPECDARINGASEAFDRNILRSLQATLIEANEEALRWARIKVDSVNAEIKDRASGSPNGRTSRNEIDYIYLRMLHERVDVDATVSTAEMLGAAMAKQIAATMQATNTVANTAKEVALDTIQMENTLLKERLAQIEKQLAMGGAPATPAVSAESVSIPPSEPVIDAEKLSVGDQVYVDGMVARITGKPFGKYTVQFADESQQTVSRERIEGKVSNEGANNDVNN